MPDKSEEGITNLGPVPEGMTFAQATERVRHLRKYQIDPQTPPIRMTVCDTVREAWRLVDAMPDSPERHLVLDYLAAAFDYGKRMDARMKELKRRG